MPLLHFLCHFILDIQKVVCIFASEMVGEPTDKQKQL
jgi:hypothetical protein